jgi:LmbE family N-acetylglucosaminyl deacetylase
VATLVSFHAHPDDEAIACGGTMARAVKEGHRVILVTATRGENGEFDPAYLEPGEELWQRRVKETEEAARVLGVARNEFLGYVDSGMIGTPENDVPESFWQADIEEAAQRLADILIEEKADVLTVYDDHGNYGHPDHIQVYRVGVRAAEIAGTPKVYESTVDRGRIKALIEMGRQLAEQGDGEGPSIEEADAVQDWDSFGSPSELITTRVDVTDFAEVKRAAMRAHGSQIAETSFFLSMPEDQFRLGFGQEDYILRGAPAGTAETWLL